MKTIKISIILENAAFGETCQSQAEEISAILKTLSNRLTENPDHLQISPASFPSEMRLHDSNGNHVGCALVHFA